MREPLVPVLGQLPDSVRGFELPTPFPVGPVNCYVLLDDPVTHAGLVSAALAPPACASRTNGG